MPTPNAQGGLTFSPSEAPRAVEHIKEIDKANKALEESKRRSMRTEVQGIASYYHKKVFGEGEVFGKAGWSRERDTNPNSAWDAIEQWRREDKEAQSGNA